MKKIFGKDKPEDLTDEDIQKITNRWMEDERFGYLLTNMVRSAILRDVNIQQIVVDKVNIYLDELFTDEDNRTKIKDVVIRQIDELHNVKILLDRIPHDSKSE